MKTIVLSLIVGTLFGAVLATTIITYAQNPGWYNDTIQGQYQRQRDILEPQMELDLLERPLPKHANPWKPC